MDSTIWQPVSKSPEARFFPVLSCASSSVPAKFRRSRSKYQKPGCNLLQSGCNMSCGGRHFWKNERTGAPKFWFQSAPRSPLRGCDAPNFQRNRKFCLFSYRDHDDHFKIICREINIVGKTGAKLLEKIIC